MILQVTTLKTMQKSARAFLSSQETFFCRNTYQVLGPKGQYFAKTPTMVIGIVNKQIVKSATASSAIKIFLAVLIPGKY